MASNTTIVEELTSAGRGVAALVIGDRKVPGYFDFSMRGLAGSFLAFIAAMLINAVLPKLMGMTGAAGSIFRSVLMVVILFAFQIGFSAIVLRQIKRLDGLVPYLVADNWATFYITLAATLLALVGLSGDISLVFIGILVIVIEINIARLIVTLTPLQIAMFLIAQLVGVSAGLIVIGALFPLTPEELAALTSQ